MRSRAAVFEEEELDVHRWPERRGKGEKVVGYDPAAGEAFRRAAQNVMIAPEVNRALAHADACIVHNDWPNGGT
jgi:hypothetical protein